MPVDKRDLSSRHYGIASVSRATCYASVVTPNLNMQRGRRAASLSFPLAAPAFRRKSCDVAVLICIIVALICNVVAQDCNVAVLICNDVVFICNVVAQDCNVAVLHLQ